MNAFEYLTEAGAFCTNLTRRDIEIDHVEKDKMICSLKVSSDLLGVNRLLTPGALANIVDEVSSVICAMNVSGVLPTTVSTVDMCFSYRSTAKIGDELEIIARHLGKNGTYSGASVLIRNKVTNAVIVEAKNSLLHKLTNKP